MLHHRLPDHLGLCEVEGRTVMLDLRRDRYFELDACTAAAFAHWRSAAQGRACNAEVGHLLARGMLIEADRPAVSGPAARTPPERSLLDGSRPPGSGAWTLVPEVAASLLGARRRLGRGLEFAAIHLRSRKPATTYGDPIPHLARFRAARRLVPLVPNCLTDSLGLAAFLARRRIRCDLVFGVKLNPFAAHCWLQIDQAVLNDSADSIATFTPIMVI